MCTAENKGLSRIVESKINVVHFEKVTTMKINSKSIHTLYQLLIRQICFILELIPL